MIFKNIKQQSQSQKQKSKKLINYKLAVEQNQALQQTIITTTYNPRQQKMSTLINSMMQLPILSQIFVCLLFFFIIYNVIVLKFIFKWWELFVQNNMHKRIYNVNRMGDINKIQKEEDKNSNNNKQNCQNKSIEQSQTGKISINKLIILLFSSFTLFEPFTINFSANKIYLIFLTNLWIFMLFCTHLFISIQNDTSADNTIDITQINFKNIFVYLSWNGLVLGFIDIGIRICSVNKILKIKFKHQITTQQKTKIIQVNNQNLQTIQVKSNSQNTNNNNQPIPCLITLYYILITISSIGLLAYTINHIITSGISSQYTNFYILSQSRQIIVKFLVGFGFIFGVHHGFIVIISIICIAICKVRQIEIENISVWLCVLGIQHNLKLTKHKQQKTIHNNQQSKQNLAEYTSRNRIQDISYINNFNPSKNLQQNALSTPHHNHIQAQNNSSSKSHTRAKSILFTANQNLFFTMKNNKVQNQSKQLQTAPPIIRIQRRKKRKKKIIYHQNSQQQNTQMQAKNQQQPAQQIPQDQPEITEKKQNNVQKYSTSKKLQINSKQLQYHQFDTNIVSEPILRNIENKIYSSTKNKAKCKQLKVIMDTSRDCQNFHASDFIDLSQYTVKDLGCANSIQRKQLQVQLSKRSDNRTFFDQTSKQKQKKKFSGYYYRKNSHKAPTVPDVKTQAFTFCMQDFSQK